MPLYPMNTKNIRKSSHTTRGRITHWKRDIIGTMPSVMSSMTSSASGASSGIGGIILQMQAKSCKWSIYVCVCTNRHTYTINKKVRIRESMNKRRGLLGEGEVTTLYPRRNQIVRRDHHTRKGTIMNWRMGISGTNVF